MLSNRSVYLLPPPPLPTHTHTTYTRAHTHTQACSRTTSTPRTATLLIRPSSSAVVTSGQWVVRSAAYSSACVDVSQHALLG